jgi:hypothetical protein
MNPSHRMGDLRPPVFPTDVPIWHNRINSIKKRPDFSGRFFMDLLFTSQKSPWRQQ